MANPSVNIVVGKGGNMRRKIRLLSDYAYVKALNRQGAYISSNKKGAALCFRSDIKKFSLKELLFEIRFALAIPVYKVFQTLKREAYLKKHRFQGTHYYFWFLGVQKDGNKTVFELKNMLFEKAREEQLPILLETSVLRNAHAYERYGFETYHIWDDSKNDMTVWFMKWEHRESSK
jgi:hypothetical protein